MHVADDIGGHIEDLEPLTTPLLAEATRHFFAYRICHHEILSSKCQHPERSIPHLQE